MKKLISHIVLSLFACVASAQDISLKTEFDTTRILIGDQIGFTVTVEQPADMKLDFPVYRDTLVRNIEIIRGPETDSSVLGENRLRIKERYLVTSFDSGYYEVPPAFIEIRNPDGLKRYYSDYARIEVMKYHVAPADSTAQFYDIIGPYKAPVTFREALPWILLAIAVAAIITAIVVIARKRRKTAGEDEVIVNPDPAHVIALRELQRLRSEELWQKGEYKEYHSRLTEILRQYLENRYRVYSLELTTSETLDELRKAGFRRDENHAMLERILTFADLVKFAKHVPLPDENEHLFNEAVAFVEGTKEVVHAVIPGERNGKEGEV